MLVNPAAATVLPPPTLTPATQAALNPGALAAQTTAAQARTQTAQAPAAASRGEQASAGKSGTQHGRRYDTLANTITAETDRQAVRGSLIDLRA